MGYVVDLAAVILGQSEKRAEIIAQNLSNSVTAGYKRSIPFSTLVDRMNIASDEQLPLSVTIDTRPGKLVKTGNPLDLAISGKGFFAVSVAGNINYSRDGRFSLGENGSLVNSAGGVLQDENGRDIVISSASFSVSEDGVISEKGIRHSKIGVFDLRKEDGELNLVGARSFDPANTSEFSLQQGWYEASNVSSGDEMVAMMEILRRAEAGQRIMNVYDDLMGRALSAFGETR
ncbi:MAG: flagellar hook basal-body protein [Sphingomonadales bacterium]|nr:flagellar hook basal-body protein [Sphingomonadales bacterium]